MSIGDIADYRWLISADARPWLASLSESREPQAAQVRKLRRALSPAQTHLVLEQVELRRRAAIKFSRAEAMFFTPRALEQATSETVARWKAERFAPLLAAGAAADLCCGIGGDLLALARFTPAVGVDRDPIAALLAGANLAALGYAGSEARCRDVLDVDIEEFAAWHLDPDRRTDRGRTSQPEFAAPGLETIEDLLRRHPHAAVKLAPAARVPETWERSAEREWISERGECKQQVAWFGRLARAAGRRAATALVGEGVSCTFQGEPAGAVPVASHLKRFFHEPDAAILAAGLADAWAEHHGLEAVSAAVAYYTSDRFAIDPATASFEVLEVAPLDRKRWKALLRERRMGRLEIKKRGVEIGPERLRNEFRVPGEEAGTLLIAPQAGRVIAILARRVS
jgi:SAM-dependent methyltransferase